ncbi:HD-GYP domain-containing protein [Sphingopyxis sp. JAI128]|uniref:HD-GYP domain-containing protein n=1 Tax=Sphingopyxis sp. JAI128 TaxID=2723066 RepID=UPI001614ADB2|nr:HD-GYP domain-containing protein [Sphingopyxis sp. JAI128]MBB6424812.1 HD-GYP domain-containing protein (c-di-GMP phosphodiesterase class II) [Sphingopyxis sp. JAI128]
MLVRIELKDVEIGMFVHAFEGSWFDHPFWRRYFRVETQEQLDRIRNSDIDGIIIDDARGRGPADGCEPVAPTQIWRAGRAPVSGQAGSKAKRVRAGGALAPPQSSADEAPRRRAGYAGECRRAKRTIERSRAAVADMFDGARLGRAVEVRRMVQLASAIGASIERDSRALINLVRLKEKDEYTYLHSVAVCALMINFARHLELGPQEVEDMGVAGLLHDVGKVAVSDQVLNKPGGLSKKEMRSVRSHPVAGHRLLASSPGAPAVALELCLRHHEKIDGTGYPGGLKGDELSLAARMGAICDVYDAVTSNRPYKQAWTPCEAMTAMTQWEGHFDPLLLDRFADSLGIYAVGTLVRLSTGELGIVVGSAGEADEDVVVRSFFDCAMLAEIDPVDRAIAPSAAHPRIVGRDSPSFWRFDDWERLRARILTLAAPNEASPQTAGAAADAAIANAAVRSGS